jgi:hypothetical protein
MPVLLTLFTTFREESRPMSPASDTSLIRYIIGSLCMPLAFPGVPVKAV